MKQGASKSFISEITRPSSKNLFSLGLFDHGELIGGGTIRRHDKHAHLVAYQAPRGAPEFLKVLIEIGFARFWFRYLEINVAAEEEHPMLRQAGFVPVTGESAPPGRAIMRLYTQLSRQ